jgi:hypothetical protein
MVGMYFTPLDPGSHDDVPLSCSAAVWEAAGGIHHRQRLVFTGTAVPVSFRIIRILKRKNSIGRI